MFSDSRSEPWSELDRPDRAGQGFLVKRFGGDPAGPSVILSVQPEGFENPAHFHDGAQFQVMLEGSAAFPAHELTPLSVHFSDSCVPYGPFRVGADFVLGVFRQRPAKQYYMSDRGSRRLRNPYGREVYASWSSSAQEGRDNLSADWALMEGAPHDPRASVRRCAPGEEVEREPAAAGEFLVVVDGSVLLEGEAHRPYSTRYHEGREAPRRAVAGPEGALLLFLTFPDDDLGRHE